MNFLCLCKKKRKFLSFYRIFRPYQRKIKRGYRGFLVNISNKINEISEKDAFINEFLQKSGDFNEKNFNLLQFL